MKYKKNGFTLVELLAVIAIIAILGVTAVAAYNGITQRTKEKAYEAKVKLIEESAIKWASENNVNYKTQISVNKLIVQGYLQADSVNDLGEIFIENPVTGENLVCKVIDLSRTNGEYDANFLASKDNCNLSEQAVIDGMINVDAYGSDGNQILFSDNYLNWTNKNISLIVSSDEFSEEKIASISYDFEGDTVTKNVSGLSKSDNKYQANANAYYNVYNVSANVIINSPVVITYTLKDGTIYSRTIVVRIDKEKPTFSIETEEDWITYNRDVTFYIDDGEGSGAKGFYVSKDKNNKGTFYTTDYKKTIQLPEIGTYYIWAVDNVGNENISDESSSLVVNNIDKTTPSCEINYIGTKGDNDWYVTEVTPNLKTSPAGESGMFYGYATTDTPKYDSGQILNGDSLNVNLAKISDTSGITYYCFVKTLVGHKSQSSSFVKVDKTKPVVSSIEVKSSSSTYNSEAVKVKITANDVTSGLSKMCIQASNDVSTCNWVNYSTSEKSLTIADGNANGGTAYVYAWVKDKAGNISEVKKSSGYLLYKNCTETVNNGSYTCGTYSGCTNVCGGGTEYATKTQKKKDKYTGVSCSSVATEKGCSQSCGGITYKDGSTCSNKCGGTYNRLAYSSIDGKTRCSSYDESSGGTKCGGITYKDGSTCSNKCGGGTYNRLAYSSIDGTTRCSSYDESSGGTACGGTQVSCGSCSANSGATCSTTCGNGTKAGTKTCTNVSTIDGSYCSAAASQSCTVSCTESSGCCTGPVTTNSEWSACTKKCGGGTKTRTVTVTECDGTQTKTTETGTCNKRKCCSSVSSSWSYGKYGSCKIYSSKSKTQPKKRRKRWKVSTYDSSVKCNEEYEYTNCTPASHTHVYKLLGAYEDWGSYSSFSCGCSRTGGYRLLCEICGQYAGHHICADHTSGYHK